MSRPVLILAERRLGILAKLFVTAVVVMIGRLVQLQVLEAGKYERLVSGGRRVVEEVAPRRGAILDRKGRVFAERVERFQLTLFPTSFREHNRIDALQDLIAVHRPDLLPRRFAAPEIGLANQVAAREARFRWIYHHRERLVRALLDLPTPDVELESVVLGERLAPFRHPRGELVLPPSKLPARIESALLRLADNEICGNLRSLRLRLAASERVGEALATTPARMIAGIENEFFALNRLAHDVLPEDPLAFWSKLFTQERRNIIRMEERVELDLDDQILKVELGTHDLGKDLEVKERRELARELEVETQSRRKLAERLMPFVAAGRLRELPVEEADRFDLINEIIEGRELVFEAEIDELSAFADYEISTLASILEVWEEDPDRIGAAFAASIRAADDFQERKFDYLSPEKEWLRILQHRNGVPYTLFDGCKFEVANRIWESFGLAEIGLSVLASEGRRYWQDEVGVASLLIGRCNRAGVPIGGLERLLYHHDERLGLMIPEIDRIDADRHRSSVARGREKELEKIGPLQGRPGLIIRRRELDRSFTTMPGSIAARHGLDVRLSLDRELQTEAEELAAEMCAALNATGAAMAVIDLDTGDVLVLASAPRVRGVDYLERCLDEESLRRERAALAAARRDGVYSKEDWRLLDHELRDRLEELALHDRASDGGSASQSPPGSVLKPIAALGMLQDGVFGHDEEIFDRKKGVVDFQRAIELSSNAFFWEGARRWGVPRLVDWYATFGLGRGIPLLVSQNSAASRLRSVRTDAAKNVVIGQGSMSLSAVEVAAMMANLARAGEVIEPRVVIAIGQEPQPIRRGDRIPVDRVLLGEISEAMAQVALQTVGPALARRLDLAGKTGTAELGGRHEGLYNAWFAGFAPRQRPRYAFAVVAERSIAMGKETAPFAARLMARVMGLGE